MNLPPLPFIPSSPEQRLQLVQWGTECARMAILPEDPPDLMFEAWVSVNHRYSEDSQHYYFNGDYGNWLACYRSMRAAAIDAARSGGKGGGE